MDTEYTEMKLDFAFGDHPCADAEDIVQQEICLRSHRFGVVPHEPPQIFLK